MRMPEEIIHQILDTLNAVHEEKIKFHNKHFDKLTRKQKNLTKMMDNLWSMFDKEVLKKHPLVLARAPEMIIRGLEINESHIPILEQNDFGWTKKVETVFYEHFYHKDTYF